jgi:cytochrome b involved in lipid metabolism
MKGHAMNDPGAEIERIRREIAELQRAERGGAPPRGPPKDLSVQEQPSTSTSNGKYGIHRKLLSVFVGLMLLGGMVVGVAALADNMKNNDIHFTPDDPGNTPIALSELALHNTPQDCWVVLHGDIYDLTNYARRHPGGASIVTRLAGTDGTMEYARFHTESLLLSVQGDKIGPLSVETGTPVNGANNGVVSDLNNNGSAGGLSNSSRGNSDSRDGSSESEDDSSDYGGSSQNYGGGNSNNGVGGGSSQNGGGNSNNGGGVSTIDCASDPDCITMVELASHNTATDCWIGLHGNVFDLTDYAQSHPGGAQVITKLAGTDGTSEYKRFHSQGLLTVVQGTLVGRLDESLPVPSTSEPSVAPSSESSSVPSSTPSSEPSVDTNYLPSTNPSSGPSSAPSGALNTNTPTVSGSAAPTDSGRSPSAMPSSEPSVAPSSESSSVPSRMPSSKPSVESSSLPSTHPSSPPLSSACASDPDCITMEELARHNTALPTAGQDSMAMSMT